MDFSAGFEAYLGGQLYTFDARHNVLRKTMAGWQGLPLKPTRDCNRIGLGSDWAVCLSLSHEPC